MSTVIAREFQFTRDFRSIRWGATLQYNLLRACMAGCVWAVFMLLVPPSGQSRAMALVYPFIWPLFYLVIVIPAMLLVSLLRSLPFVGLFGAFLALISVAIGDPLVCLIKRFAPAAVPVEEPSLFSLIPVFWVLDASELSIAK